MKECNQAHPTECPFSSLESAIACQTRDMSVNSKDAWMWGIVLGWDCDPEDQEDSSEDPWHVCKRWTEEAIARLKRLHSEFTEAHKHYHAQQDLLEEIARLKAHNDRLARDRYEALTVHTKEGLLASEWVSRTGRAETKLKEIEKTCQDSNNLEWEEGTPYFAEYLAGIILKIIEK